MLSAAEEAGWRRFWDGWVICPPCQAKHVAAVLQPPREWPVPAIYDRPIADDAKCSHCQIAFTHLESSQP